MIIGNIPSTVEQWGVYELKFQGKSDGNPFVDYQIKGEFRYKEIVTEVNGFYDGDGTYVIRFMPTFIGEHRFEIKGNFADEVFMGTFNVTKAKSANNHGPVRVRGHHFEYEDGTSYYPIGTTAYVWVHQSDKLIEKTLEELAKGYFNKIRFCIHPKHYLYNLHEPVTYPYIGTPTKDTYTRDSFNGGVVIGENNDWDFKQFNPKHFRRIENAIAEVGKLGIEADLICMHPYDRWGFTEMSSEEDDLYWQYIIARFAAYRNVWWSLANEYDLLLKKTVADWERYAGMLLDYDPYNHLRSIHNCHEMYDHHRPWITHCSMQRQDVYRHVEYTDEFKMRFKKPIVFDEIGYEGNIDQGWGNISGKELIRRSWETTMRGGYPTHGETYDRTDSILWWSHGGPLHGESQERLKFLGEVLKETPGIGLKRIEGWWDEVLSTVDSPFPSGYFIYYYGFNRPCRRHFNLDENKSYEVEVIDTWEMIIEKVGIFSGKFVIDLPGKEYMAIRLKEVTTLKNKTEEFLK